MQMIPIGRGLWRVKVKSKAKREALSKTPGIRVVGERVIFPEEMYGAVKGGLLRKSRKRREKPEQMKIKMEIG